VTIPKRQKHRIARWLIQILFLALFLFLFFQIRYGNQSPFQDIFFRLDPLILLVTSIAQRAILWVAGLSVLLVVTTLILGRFFCGFVCPLGTVIDVSDSMIRLRRRNEFSARNGKYIALLLLAVFALAGTSFLHFFDPLIILERALTLVFFPVVTHLAGLLLDVRIVGYTETVAAFLVLALVIGFGFVTPRFWCRNVCPLGGLLGALSHFSLFRFSLYARCEQCSVCQAICPTGAISSGEARVDSRECIVCLRCQYECPHDAIRYGMRRSVNPFDLKRRQFLTGMGASILSLSAARFFVRRKPNPNLIRPPGSIPEEAFLSACIHCGRCMKVCPTNGLQPCILEAGIEGLWTPRLIPRIGGCEKNCNMCGQVCPTSAIRRLPLEEKIFVKMGSAAIHRPRCIAWAQNMVCLICDEACPHNAIRSVNRTIRGISLPRPLVDERICTGCGLCESRCPTEGQAAIQVFAIGEERKAKGSYITEEKVRLRTCEEKTEDIPSGFILDGN